MLLRPSEAARALGIQPPWLHILAERKIIPFLLLPSGRRRFDTDVINSIIAARERCQAAGKRWYWEQLKEENLWNDHE
jgi:hypothetical protein